MIKLYNIHLFFLREHTQATFQLKHYIKITSVEVVYLRGTFPGPDLSKGLIGISPGPRGYKHPLQKKNNTF